VHDRQTGITDRVSVASDGTPGNRNSSSESINSDGRFVAFASDSYNLVPGDTNGQADIFVHDRQTEVTEQVSVASDGSKGNDVCFNPCITADGRFVAFTSRATNLVPGDDMTDWDDIFVHDRQTGITDRVSVASDGTLTDNHSGGSSISSDGRFVAFWSWATNLVPGDTNGQADIFVHDRQTGVTERVSVAADGTQGNDGGSDRPSISADGRFVVFESSSSNLVPGDTNEAADVFVACNPLAKGVNPVLNPVNGHYYQIISAAGISWSDANTDAEAMEYSGSQGHLVTISSADENIWLTENFGPDNLHLHWIGGFQPPGSIEPDGGWKWVNGEPWGFNNWWPPAEPNNLGGNENCVKFDHGLTTSGKSWNDADCEIGAAEGYVVEYSSWPCVQPPAGLVSWWPGDGNANDIIDRNDGILKGGATFASAKVGQGFFLDGIDDFVDAGNDPILHVSDGDFTVDAWVFFNELAHPPGGNIIAPQGDMSIVDKMSTNAVNGNIDGWRLLKQDDNRFYFCLGGGEAGDGCNDPAFTVYSTTVSTTGVWFHIAAVKSATSFSIYVNGQLQDSRSPVPSFLDTHSANLRIGSNAVEGSHLNGLIDEVEIFNRALSTAEIQAIFLASSKGKCKGVIVSIDIKPGSYPNSINLRSKGKVPVAILTTDDFDAQDVDPETCVFAGGGPLRWNLYDLGKDGDYDMILYFKTQDLEDLNKDSTEASIECETYDGIQITGTDSVKIVPKCDWDCNKHKKHNNKMKKGQVDSKKIKMQKH
jgi:hypothetical protein